MTLMDMMILVHSLMKEWLPDNSESNNSLDDELNKLRQEQKAINNRWRRCERRCPKGDANHLCQMETDLDECNERFLRPLVKGSPFDLCEISLEHKDGWKAISILIDCGASDSGALDGHAPRRTYLRKRTPRKETDSLPPQGGRDVQARNSINWLEGLCCSIPSCRCL